jgi:Flp pilus assembly protein TadG
MALCLPVLMLIVTGLLTFSVALNNYLELSNAVTMGGRALASSRGATDPCSAASTAVYQAAPFLNHGTTVLTMTYVFYDKAHNTLGSGSGKSCTADASNMVPNGSVQLTLTYPCNLSVFGYQFVPGCKMETQTTEYLQ